MATKKKSQRQFKRGDKKYYSDLARKSVNSRIRRHIIAEVRTDPELRASVPFRSRDTDAGYDIATPKRFDLPPGVAVSVGTGVQVKCPKGYFYELRGRSSLNIKGIEVIDGIIDATYTGEIKVLLKNNSDQPVAFKAGDRIAQIVFLPQIHVEFEEVEAFKDETGGRGSAGFGSTGV